MIVNTFSLDFEEADLALLEVAYGSRIISKAGVFRRELKEPGGRETFISPTIMEIVVKDFITGVRTGV